MRGVTQLGRFCPYLLPFLGVTLGGVHFWGCFPPFFTPPPQGSFCSYKVKFWVNSEQFRGFSPSRGQFNGLFLIPLGGILSHFGGIFPHFGGISPHYLPPRGCSFSYKVIFRSILSNFGAFYPTGGSFLVSFLPHGGYFGWVIFGVFSQFLPIFQA